MVAGVVEKLHCGECRIETRNLLKILEPCSSVKINKKHLWLVLQEAPGVGVYTYRNSDPPMDEYREEQCLKSKTHHSWKFSSDHWLPSESSMPTLNYQSCSAEYTRKGIIIAVPRYIIFSDTDCCSNAGSWWKGWAQYNIICVKLQILPSKQVHLLNRYTSLKCQIRKLTVATMCREHAWL